MLLVGKGLRTLLPYAERHHNLGRLIQPRDCSSPRETSERLPWAADNDCFNGGLDERLWGAMLRVWAGRPGCLWATVPDVVGDADATLRSFEIYEPWVREASLPAALVTQDGMRPDDVPWPRIAALFIGGTDDHKLGQEARTLIRAAKALGKWVHMGRVNTRGRTRYACALGVDSIDGTSVSRFTDRYLRERATDALCLQQALSLEDMS